MDEGVAATHATQEDACGGIIEEGLGLEGEGVGTGEQEADDRVAQENEIARACV